MRQWIQAHAPHWPVALVLVACFGPYLAFGLRTEQVVVYALALPAVVRLSQRWLPGAILAGGLAWLSLVAVAASSGLVGPGDSHRYIAGVDNLLLPVAAGLVAIDWSDRWSAHELLLAMSHWLVLLLSANTLVIGLSLVSEPSWLAHFWSGDATIGTVGAMGTVAERAATMGRLSGVFNQPVEAGVAYSLGVLLLAYRTHYRRTLALIPWWVLLMAGGLASVSKVFLLLGVPVTLAYLLYTHQTQIIRVVPVVLAATAGTWAALSGAWTGGDRVRWLFSGDLGDHTAVQWFTAGRYGTTGDVSEVIDMVLADYPITGYGAAGTPVAYDSAYVEVLVFGGLLGLGCYLLALIALFVCWLDIPFRRPQGALILAVLAVTVAAGLGGPTFTANRIGVPLTIVLVGVLYTSAARQAELVSVTAGRTVLGHRMPDAAELPRQVRDSAQPLGG